MKRKHHTPEQIIHKLRQADAELRTLLTRLRSQIVKKSVPGDLVQYLIDQVTALRRDVSALRVSITPK